MSNPFDPYHQPVKVPKPKKPLPKTPPPTIQKPIEDRSESPGEAAVRLASLIITIFRVFKVQFYKHEEEGLQKAMGAFVRRWPILKKKKVN